MAPIETHWSIIQGFLLKGEVSAAELAICREMFYGGCLSLLAILAELNHERITDAEFNKRIDELFREASTGVLDRYKVDGIPFASVRRH